MLTDVCLVNTHTAVRYKKMKTYLQAALITGMVILSVMSHSPDRLSVSMDKIFDHMLRLERTVSKLSTKLESTELANRQLKDNSKRLDKVIEDLAKQSSVINNLRKSAGGAAGLVSFEARLRSNLNIGSKEIIKFDEVTFNKGGGYNRKTGIFTAPVTGTYIFWASVVSIETDDIRVGLYIDGKDEVNGYTSRTVKYGTAHITYITQVSRGKHVWFVNLEAAANTKIYGDIYSSYGGTLLATI